MSLFKQRKTARRKRNADEPIGCFTLFGVVWMLIVLGIDAFFVSMAYKTIDARQRFLPARGVVVESRVESHSDSDGTTYSPYIEYAYEIGSETYRNDRYSMFEFSSSSRAYARDAVDRYPRGAEIEVFYDRAIRTSRCST